MMKQIRIAVSGKAASGKDTLADALVSLTGARKVAFADPMREAFMRLSGFDAAELEQLKRGIVTPVMHAKLPASLKDEAPVALAGRYRAWMQSFGTECTQALWARDAWTHHFEDTVDKSSLEQWSGIIVSDLRFVHEYDCVSKLSFFRVRVYSPGFEGAGSKSMHSSETSLDVLALNGGFDCYILNDRRRTPGELASEVMMAMRAKSREPHGYADHREWSLKGGIEA